MENICLDHQVQHMSEIDASYREEEEEGNDQGFELPSGSQSRADRVVISWEPNDPENPLNWSAWKKGYVVFTTSLLVANSTMGSSIPSMAIPAITQQFHIASQEQHVLLLSIYLVGYIAGPILWGPLSEHFGRRYLTIITFFTFMLATAACALAPNWPSLLVFRLISGCFASAPITVVAGYLADIYNEPRARGRAFSIFVVASTFGPLFSPIISGFATPTIGWRWSFWISLILAGIAAVFAVFLPETFAPILLARRAKKLRAEARKTNPDSPAAANVFAPRDLEATDFRKVFTAVLTRPLRMIAYEPIVSSICAYIALVYAIFYMSFQVFPIIFQSLYGLSPGVTGLTYLSVGGGALLSLPVAWCWDNVLQRGIASGADWTKREEYRRLPVACLGGPLFVISLFWLGFSARQSVPFVAPLLAGVPFGMGYILVVLALLNYLTDAYEIYAASANAAVTASRSIGAIVLPLATTPMFAKLGISGACSLFGGLSAVMCILPLIFIWKGPSIRARSQFCSELREKKEEMLRKAKEGIQSQGRLEMRNDDRAVFSESLKV
ncbi:bicyclomycin resistance [Trichoderma cornu-damae]|uniref:Bicyclomycin resistance n=1 Tax=Trichoderma cornu-damae TaxID=654480 RepID=A0A9P8TWY4_9HYPO|nr:bicyclomycin resistance [Trichoderma cornu-damae]